MSVTWVLQGAVTSTSVTVTAKVTSLSAKLLVADNSELRGGTFSSVDTADANGVAIMTMTGLDPDTEYFWAVHDGTSLDTDLKGVFRTHPTIGDVYSFTFAAASCAGGNPDFPGPSTALASDRISNHPVFDTIRLHHPLFFAHLGDMHYYDLGSGLHSIAGGATAANYRTAIDDVLSCVRQQRLYRSTPLAYVWDDHDFGPDNSDGTFASKANPALVYRERIPSYTLDDASSIYQSFEVGRVLFVMSDTRYNRSDDGDTDNSSKVMLGSTQISWLDTLLAGTSAEALVWLNPTPWLGLSSDTWHGFTHERNQLVQLFGDNGFLDRMVCINGDYHGLAMDRGGNEWGGFPVYVWGSLDSPPGSTSTPTNQYDLGPTLPGNNQWGQMRVIDRGHTIDLIGAGMVGSSPWRVDTKRITTSTAFSTTFPSQPAPWKVEIAPGGDPVNLRSWTWVDITNDVRVADGITIGYGRADEWATTGTTTCDLTLNNSTGNYSPRNPKGTYFGQLGRNTPLRVTFNDKGERFVGFVTDWPPRWDQSANDAYAPIQASGIMRRLSQGSKPVPSPLRRAILGHDSLPAAYWPMEDDAGATNAASAVGKSEMRIFDDPTLTAPTNAAARPKFGSADGPPGAAGGVELPYSFRLQGHVTGAESATSWSVEFWAQFPDEETSTDNTFTFSMLTHNGTFDAIEFVCDPAGTYDLSAGYGFGSGAVSLIDGTTFNGTLRGVHHFAFTIETDGSDYNWEKYLDGESIASGTVTSSDAGNPDLATLVNSANDPSDASIYVGHLAVWPIKLEDTDIKAHYDAGRGHIGETAPERIARLCFEEGVPFYPVSGGADSPAMGVQPAGSLLDILRDAEKADGGILHETSGGLSYLASSDRYNLPVSIALDVDSGHVAAPPEPTDDDQRLRNEVTAQRSGGSAATFTDDDSVTAEGLYSEEVTVSVRYDDQLIDVAGWRVHLGTVDEMRWPKISLDLAKNTGLIDDWLNFGPSGRITVDQSLTQLPGVDVDVLVEGWTEHLNVYDWDVELNAVPASPWDVGTLAAPVKFVGADSTTANSTSITVPLPEGWEAGQLAVLIVAANGTAGTMADPTDWTEIDSTPFETGSMEVGVWWKILESGDTDPVVTYTETQKMAGATAVYPGANSLDPIAAVGTHGTRSTTTGDIVAGSVTTTEDHQRIIGFFAEKSSTATAITTEPTGMAQRIEQFGTGGGATSVAIFDEVIDDVGESGSRTATYDTTSGTGYGLLVAINANDETATDRLDTDGSTLVADITSSATTFDVITTEDDDPRWTTDDADMPLYIKTGGEVMKVTSIDNAVSDDFTTAASNGWGTDDTGQSWSTEGGLASDYSVASGVGVHTQHEGGHRFYTLIGSYADVELLGQITTPVLPTGGAVEAGFVARNVDANNQYHCWLKFDTDASIDLQLFKHVAGAFGSALDTYFLPNTQSAGTRLWLRFRVVGEELMARSWIDGKPEPQAWQVTATNSELTAAGAVGCHTSLLATNTNSDPYDIHFDNFDNIHQQTFTVVRAVNGISKAHDAGDDVRLAYPLILGL